MINIQIVGDKALSLKLNYMTEKTKKSLTQAITILSIKLKNHIIKDKLSGQVLNHRTGNLWRSIQQEVHSEGTSIIGKVFSAGDVKYAAIHEYGGSVRTRLGTGVGKPKPGGKATIEMPERSFMRSSLADMRDEIVERLSVAVGDGIK